MDINMLSEKARNAMKKLGEFIEGTKDVTYRFWMSPMGKPLLAFLAIVIAFGGYILFVPSQGAKDLKVNPILLESPSKEAHSCIATTDEANDLWVWLRVDERIVITLPDESGRIVSLDNEGKGYDKFRLKNLVGYDSTLPQYYCIRQDGTPPNYTILDGQFK